MRRGIAGLSLSAYTLLYRSTLCLYYKGQLLVLEASAMVWVILLFATFYISGSHLARLQTDAIILLIATADCWGGRKKVSRNNTIQFQFFFFKNKNCHRVCHGPVMESVMVLVTSSHRSYQMSQK